jgi:hypothetical protein
MNLLHPLDATSAAEHIARVRDEKIRELTELASDLTEKARAEDEVRQSQAKLLAACTPLAPQCKSALVGTLQVNMRCYETELVLAAVGLYVVGVDRGHETRHCEQPILVFTALDKRNELLPNAPRLKPDTSYRAVLFLIEEERGA